jgi:hypothetical protein
VNIFLFLQILGDRVDVMPHYIIRRYAEYVSAIRVIGVTYSDNRLETALSGTLYLFSIILPNESKHFFVIFSLNLISAACRD